MVAKKKKNVHFLYSYDKDYDIIYPMDATGNICKTGEIELVFHSDFKPSLSKAIQPLNEDDSLVSPDIGDFFYITGEKIISDSPVIERRVHEKLILKPFFAVDLAMLLIDLASSTSLNSLDKEAIVKKLQELTKKLK